MSLSDQIEQATLPLPPDQCRPELLLCGQIPAPLHGVNPRSIMGDEWWSAVRVKAIKLKKNHCHACGVHQTRAIFRQSLEGHEVYTLSIRKHRLFYVETVALCHYCHNYIHAGRLEMLFRAGKIKHDYYASILDHGDRVLARYSMKPPAPVIIQNVVQSWSLWRMVFDGKEYPPKYRDVKAWEEAYR